MLRKGRQNATGAAQYDQMITSVQNNWWQLLVAVSQCRDWIVVRHHWVKYGIKYSLASESDRPDPCGWGPTQTIRSPHWNLGVHAKKEFPHLRFSTLTTGYDCIAVVEATRAVGARECGIEDRGEETPSRAEKVSRQPRHAKRGENSPHRSVLEDFLLCSCHYFVIIWVRWFKNGHLFLGVSWWIAEALVH